jgi:hypothetical protein
MFLAAALLLQPHQLVHFDDVPFLHQHLVANLPQIASPALRPEDITGGVAAQGAATVVAATATAAAARAKAATDDEADDEAPPAAVVATRRPPSPSRSTSSAAKPSPSPAVRLAAGGAPGALLFLSGAAHAAAAAHTLARWRPARPGCELRLRPCAAAALGLEARATALALLHAAVPTAVALAPLRLLDEPAPTPGGGLEPGGAVGAAADMLVRMGAQLGGGGGGGGGVPATGAAPRLLLLCVDETDGLTLAASLAARLLGIRALNVCDEDGVVDGTTPLPQAAQHAGLQAALDAAADCPVG